MFIHVTQAKYIDEYRVWLAFNDGAQGEIDLSSELYGEVFEPLQDPSFFRSFTLEGHTLSWKNGADFAPEFLREHIMQKEHETPSSLVSLVTEIPYGIKCRKWNGNDKSQRNHNGKIPLSEDPIYLHLNWKKGPGETLWQIGCFRLSTSALLKEGYIRKDRKPGHVRLRFFHDHDDSIYIQSNNDGPKIKVGEFRQN